MVQRIEQPDREWDEAIKILELFAAGFADLSPEEIEPEVSQALAEVRAEQRGDLHDHSGSVRP